MVCSILSVGPLTRSKAASSVRRKSWRRAASSRLCGVTPARACPCFPGVAFRRGGGSIPSPTRAHRSVPISAGMSRVGRMLNVCCRVLPCIVTGSETRPGIVALVPSAKRISPSPYWGRIFISRTRQTVSALMIDISEPVSSKADTERPSRRIVTCGRGVNFRQNWCRAGAR